MEYLRPMENTATLAQVDPAIAQIVIDETRRQEDGLELIASENFVSPAVLEAMGSTLTNKYAEGYPGKRYYGGCEEVDKAESLAIDRVLKLFGAQAANVQAHSGSQANMAAYMALMKPGETLLAMDLNSGGHLTHGAVVQLLRQALQDRCTTAWCARPRPSTTRRPRRWPRSTSPRSSWSAPPPTRASSTSPPSRRSPTRWARR